MNKLRDYNSYTDRQPNGKRVSIATEAPAEAGTWGWVRIENAAAGRTNSRPGCRAVSLVDKYAITINYITQLHS